MKQFAFLAVLSILGILVLDLQSICFAIVLYVIGDMIVRFTNRKERGYLIKLYHTLYNAGLFYAIACNWYMKANNYDWLLAFDTINYFLPETQRLVEEGGGSYLQTLDVIFKEYNTFLEKQYFYFAYTCLFGFISQKINADFYFVIQLSTLFLFPFVGVFLYKILRLELFDKTTSYKYSLLICILSVVFFYSSQILRDLHVMLLYIVAIYITMRYKASIFSLSLLSIIIFITLGLRVESGLFLCLFIPILLIASIKKRSTRQYVLLLSVVVMAILFYIIQQNYLIIQMIYETNLEEYINPIAEGSGVIGTLQRVPIIGGVLSIFYNAIQPLPVWRMLFPTDASIYGGEAYNIMCVTRFTSAFVNWITIVYIFYWIFGKEKKMVINKVFVYHLWLGFVFLYLQSAVMAQRRIMAYYCMYYIFALMVYKALRPSERKMINTFACVVFLLFQIIGVFYI